MANKNYVKGRRKEYKLKTELESKGYLVLRTAGSHGFADLIAINPERNTIQFIQVKPDNFSTTKESQLMATYEWLESDFWSAEFIVL